MCFIVYAVKLAFNCVLVPVIIKLMVEVLVGCVSYWILSKIFKIDVFVELVNLVKKGK
jgi:hypothetical protein